VGTKKGKLTSDQIVIPIHPFLFIMKYIHLPYLASLSLMCILLTGCQEAGPIVDIEAEKQLISELSQQWADAESQKDLEGSLSMLWDDAVMLPPDADVVEGIDAISQLYQDFFEQVPYSSLTLAPTAITVAASGDVAYNWGNLSLEFDGPDAPPVVTMKFIATWEKRGGTWKVTANMFSYNSPQSAE